jgi:hypothetical protein
MLHSGVHLRSKSQVNATIETPNRNETTPPPIASPSVNDKNSNRLFSFPNLYRSRSDSKILSFTVKKIVIANRLYFYLILIVLIIVGIMGLFHIEKKSVNSLRVEGLVQSQSSAVSLNNTSKNKFSLHSSFEEDLSLISKSRKFIYYADNRWGGVNNQLLMFRSAIEIAYNLEATLVLEDGYKLWRYLDMNSLKSVVPLVWTHNFFKIYQDTLNIHQIIGAQCVLEKEKNIFDDGSICLQLCSEKDETCSNPPYYCDNVTECKRGANEQWMPLSNVVAKDVHVFNWENSRKHDQDLEGRAIVLPSVTNKNIGKTSSLIIINPYKFWEYRNHWAWTKPTSNSAYLQNLQRSFLPTEIYRKIVELFYRQLPEPHVAVHLRDLSDGVWDSEFLVTSYALQVMGSLKEHGIATTGTLYIAFSPKHDGIRQTAELLMNMFPGKVVTITDVIINAKTMDDYQFQDELSLALDPEIRKLAGVFIDMWACVFAKDFFIGKTKSTFTDSVRLWRNFYYPRRKIGYVDSEERFYVSEKVLLETAIKQNLNVSEVPPMTLVCGVCTKPWEVAEFGASYECSDSDYMEFVSRYSLVSKQNSCNPCIAPLKFDE